MLNCFCVLSIFIGFLTRNKAVSVPRQQVCNLCLVYYQCSLDFLREKIWFCMKTGFVITCCVYYQFSLDFLRDKICFCTKVTGFVICFMYCKFSLDFLRDLCTKTTGLSFVVSVLYIFIGFGTRKLFIVFIVEVFSVLSVFIRFLTRKKYVSIPKQQFCYLCLAYCQFSLDFLREMLFFLDIHDNRFLINWSVSSLAAIHSNVLRLGYIYIYIYIYIYNYIYIYITPVLRTLHWLPVRARTEYTIASLCHQCTHTSVTPTYLR